MCDDVLGAIASGDESTFESIVPSQLPVDSVIQGKPLLSHAIGKSALSIVRYLLDNKADTFICDESGVSPLFTGLRFILLLLLISSRRFIFY